MDILGQLHWVKGKRQRRLEGMDSVRDGGRTS